MIRLLDQLRTQAVQQVLGALGGNPAYISGESRSPRIELSSTDTVIQEFTFREDGTDWLYQVVARVEVGRQKL